MKVAIFGACITCLMLTMTCSGYGQQDELGGTKADYERMGAQRQITRNKVFRDRLEANWFADDTRLWYQVNSGPGSHEFVFVDVIKGERQPAFDHRALAGQLATATGQKVSGDRLPLSEIVFDENAEFVFFQAFDKHWKWNRSGDELESVDGSSSPSPDPGNLKRIKPSADRGGEIHVTFVNKREETVRLIWIDREGRRQPYGEIASGDSFEQHTFAGHVWLVEGLSRKPLALLEASGNRTVVIDRHSGIELEKRDRSPRRRSGNGARAVSPDGRWQAVVHDHNLYVQDLQKESDDDSREHQLTRSGSESDFFSRSFYWSPDSSHLVVLRVQPAEKHEISMIESSPDEQVQPRLHSMRYLKPGDRIRREIPCLFDVKTMSQIDVSTELFDNPWRIQGMQWRNDSSEFTFLYNQRGHQVLRLVGIDAHSGKTRAIIDEPSQTFVDYSGKFFLRRLPETDEIIWMSERDGWNHLYLVDAIKGKIRNQITRGEWVVRGVDQVDMENRTIHFRASGVFPDQDPYLIHFCHVNFDGSDLVVMTRGNGTHAIEYSPNGEYIIDSFSRVDMAPRTQLRRSSDGALVCELEEADTSRLIQTGWQPPETFVAAGRDGKTDIHGVVYLPSNMDPDRKYPVIEYIYAGPHSAFVPKRFFLNRSEKALAELGFIVVQIDGMGTSHRSKAFHDVCWKNLGDSGFPDRIAWMKAAAREKYPQMDLSRVGIYGGSAGGQSALRAMLAHPEFYGAAVSDCGCHDNRMDKIWWNELWMSWPVGPHYEEQSNVTNAHKLQGDLLLIVGELDRNVDPASTMQVVDALIKADKDFELLVVPGAGHGIGSGRYGMRRTRDFFVRKLLHVEPRRQ